MMNTTQLETQVELLVRILLAGTYEGIIGYERKSRSKEVDIHTHLVVVGGAVLITVVPRYGFSDILGDKGAALDPSHVAVQVMTGVSFLGVGVIFIWKSTISRLMTVTGTQAISTIGMATGSGPYVLGILTAVLIVFVQIILHQNHRQLQGSYKGELSFVIDQNKKALQDLQEHLKRMRIETLSVSLTQKHSCYQVDLIIVLPSTYQTAELLDMFYGVAYIHKIDA